MRRGPYKTLKRRLYAAAINTARAANQQTDAESRAIVRAMFALLSALETNDVARLRSLVTTSD